MHRRTFLKALLQLPAGGYLLCRPLSRVLANPVSKRRFVDLHCHFFNAADLPVRGFLERVVLADYAAGQARAAQTGIGIGVWRGLVAKLTDLMLRQRAPTPKKELDFLRATAGTAGASRQMIRGLVHKNAPESYPSKEILAEVLGSAQQAQRPSAESVAPLERAVPRAPGGGSDTDEFADFVRQEMRGVQEFTPAEKLRGLEAPGPSAAAPQAPASAQSIAAFIASGRSFFSRYFQWAGLLTDYRANIAERYRKLYDPENTRVALVTPALIDFNFWLNDQSPAPLREQIEVMSLLSLRLPFPMHGFVPFDPLREVRRLPGEDSSLRIVKDAIRRHGFLGVKLYSPMGFRPAKNAELGFPFPAPAGGKELGKRLDDALDGLYAWCEREQVPILAHSTDSQSAGPDFASRAEPKFWLSVLEKYPRLRVNLAHFGNFNQAFAGANGSDPESHYEKTWEYEIGEFIRGRHFRNVYADISYFYWVLDGKAETQKTLAVKRMFAKYLESDPNVEHLLFGTDWNMTGKAQNLDGYVDNVEAFFKDLGL
ncbi:MAG TPA: amidohydrolase family protein, partial [Hyphomicrobiales bacterium]|nr:amidohydrolase family protein [Hyphomicrobiales bacterium]